MVFGKSLNLTAISILMALVFWTSVWGLMGAILSVPLLAILSASDEPGIAREMEQHRAARYGTVKVKVGFDVAEDLAALKNLAQSSITILHFLICQNIITLEKFLANSI